MFGIDPKSLSQGMSQLTKLAEDQKRMADAIEQLNKLLPDLISELKKLNHAATSDCCHLGEDTNGEEHDLDCPACHD